MRRTHSDGQSHGPLMSWTSAARRTVRQITLAVLAIWRCRFPPAAEVAQRRLVVASRELQTTDTRMAAEEFHWADAIHRRERIDIQP